MFAAAPLTLHLKNTNETSMTLSAIWTKTKELVSQNGWATMSVFPDPDASAPSTICTYSIGLSQEGQPDIIVFGLQPSLANVLIADIAARLLKRPGALDRQPIEPGKPIEDLVRGRRLMLLEVIPSIGAEHALLAAKYADECCLPLRVWQLVWPDQNGLLPWESDVHPESVAHQPLLGRSMRH